jgi:hypothetical protein
MPAALARPLRLVACSGRGSAGRTAPGMPPRGRALVATTIDRL